MTRANYQSELQLFDPSYCPPEAPPKDKGGEGGIDLRAGGAYDVFSAGLLVMQMVFPPLRTDQGIKRFKAALEREDYDLMRWRNSMNEVRQYERGFEILDEHGGWALLRRCLRKKPSSRISAGRAAASRFCRV